MTEISQPSPHPSGSDRCCGQKHHKSPATIFMVVISSVEPLQHWVAEHRGLRHWRAHGATLKSKIEGAWSLRRDREERSWGGWPVAASPEMGTRDEAWLEEGQPMISYCSAPLLVSLPFMKHLPSRLPSLNTQFSLTSTLSKPVTWLFYERIRKGCLILINWYCCSPDTTHSIERTLHCSDIRHRTKAGKLHCWSNPLNSLT